jgi:hypothetical protein
LPPVQSSQAPVELTLDLRSTPPDKVLARLFGALDRVGQDVTLLVLLRDTPEYAGVVASAYQALRARGYVSDSARVPPGGQRLRVQRRRDREGPRAPAFPAPAEAETYMPATEREGDAPPVGLEDLRDAPAPALAEAAADTAAGAGAGAGRPRQGTTSAGPAEGQR